MIEAPRTSTGIANKKAKENEINSRIIVNLTQLQRYFSQYLKR